MKKSIYIYQEKQKTNLMVIMVYMVIAVFLLGLILYPGFYNFSERGLFVKIILILIAVVDLILFWSFSELKIALTEEYLQFGFGFFKRKINWQNIKEISIEDLNRKNFIGYGVRRGKDGNIGFIAKGSEGVKFTTHQNQVYFFTASNPSEIIKISRNYI